MERLTDKGLRKVCWKSNISSVKCSKILDNGNDSIEEDTFDFKIKKIFRKERWGFFQTNFGIAKVFNKLANGIVLTDPFLFKQ